MITLEDLLILARTIYGEARGESFQGKMGVGNVMLNRVKARHRKESTIVGVCTEPYQFSAWNENDPNREKIQSTTVDHPDYRECLMAALCVLSPENTDFTKGSTHYHTKSIMPSWAEGHEPVAEVGRHVFYNTVK